MISPRGLLRRRNNHSSQNLVRMSAVTHGGPLKRAAYVRVSPSIRCRREGLGVLSQMASEEHLGEVRRLRVNRVAADVRRRCTAREGWHARLACNPRQRRSARHRREKIVRSACGKCEAEGRALLPTGTIASAAPATTTIGMSIRSRLSGRKAGPSAGAITNTAHALVAVGAAVIR